MQFNRDEYAFLSRRGSVPPARRSRRRPDPEGEPGRVESRPSARGQSGTGAAAVRLALARRLEPARRVGRAARGAADDYRAGVRATWTAFGPGGRDEFGGR
jgi:hypothetical protein